MATTQEILDAAAALGKLIQSHEAARNLEDTLEQLQQDTDAQRLLNDYNRQIQKIAQLEAQQKPVEVNDKHELERLQSNVVRHPLLDRLQMAQMDYVDLMRRVDDAMAGPAPKAPTTPPPSAGATAPSDAAPPSDAEPGGPVITDT